MAAVHQDHLADDRTGHRDRGGLHHHPILQGLRPDLRSRWFAAAAQPGHPVHPDLLHLRQHRIRLRRCPVADLHGLPRRDRRRPASPPEPRAEGGLRIMRYTITRASLLTGYAVLIAPPITVVIFVSFTTTEELFASPLGLPPSVSLQTSDIVFNQQPLDQP